MDRAVQQILADRGYQSVIVYFSDAYPRNNIGNWQTRQIPNPDHLTGKSRYQLKDKAMATDCDCGIMFWDGYSKGTKQNMDCLDTLGKPYIVNKPNTSVSVSLPPKMRLKQALKEAGIENPATVTKLTISGGTLIGRDFGYIRGKMGKILQKLDVENTELDKFDFSVAGCTALISISIPASLKGIFRPAFVGCNNLIDVTVHPDNPDYSSDSGVMFSKDKTKLAYYPMGRKGDYVIPNSVTRVGTEAFYYCAGLTSVTIPHSVTQIGDNAFDGCTGLTSVSYKGTVLKDTPEKIAEAIDLYRIELAKIYDSEVSNKPSISDNSENTGELKDEWDFICWLINTRETDYKYIKYQ